MNGKENDGKRPKYIVDEMGSVTPETARIHEVNGLTFLLGTMSETLVGACSNLKKVAAGLGADREDMDFAGNEGCRKNPYTFACESESKEELFKIAGYLGKLNMRIWAVMRTLGTQSQNLAEEIHLEDDTKFSAELDRFLKSDPVGFTVMGQREGGGEPRP